MVEVKGFNEILARAEETETIKKLAKQYRQRKVQELVKMGIDKTIAKAMVEAGLVH